MLPLQSNVTAAILLVVMLMVATSGCAREAAQDEEDDHSYFDDDSDCDDDDDDDDVPEEFVWESLTFEDCGSTTDLRVVQISTCTYVFDEPCRIPIDRPIHVTVEFGKRDQDLSHMQHEAFWVLNTVNTRIGVSPGMCEGVDCPFEGPDGLAFNATVSVPSRFPEFRGSLFWKVYDRDGDTLICFKTPIQLYTPVQPIKTRSG